LIIHYMCPAEQFFEKLFHYFRPFLRAKCK
jgi:hypothetical protein